jgi:Fe-S-cluster-containing dehydrogenase component
MKKWNLVIDVEKCNGCFNCFLACKDEHVGNEFPGYAAAQPLHGHRWIDIRTVERGQVPMVDFTYLPTMCNQCDDAPCVRAGQGAVRKRDDGIVMIDPAKAQGRKDLVAACPYGAIWWNEERQVPQKWYFDAHLLDRGWKQPRCVQACGTGAMRSIQVEDEEMQRMVQSEELQVLHPEYGTRPRVYYKNLHHVDRCFVGGTVIASVAGVKDCVRGATAVLKKDGGRVADAETDAFGEFRIDRLEPGSGLYTLEIAAPGHERHVRDVDLGKSLYLGTIELRPLSTQAA